MLRPRNVDWKRAAALLYGDWGTSKAYVLGLAFFFSGYAALPILLAVCLLTGLVGYCYTLICRFYPDGGGVYSAARGQSRLLASVGALLLVANFLVTAALSCQAAMSYFGVPGEWLVSATVALVLAVGTINFFGPKHTGSLAVWVAVPMVVVVVLIVALSLPHLTFQWLRPPTEPLRIQWQHFVGIILALSGVEAIANLTGVMKLDPDSPIDRPSVAGTARRAILLVALEVVLGTALLGWAMVSLPPELAPAPDTQRDYMLRFLGEQYAALAWGAEWGRVAAVVVGAVVGLLLLSAVSTAIAAQIGLVYMLARDGELPGGFTRLNRYGVPWWPWLLATVLPALTVMVTGADLEALARLYAIGVVGAIVVNLGSCTFNGRLALTRPQRAVLGATFVVLFLVELTIAKTNADALFFAICVLGVGLGLRGYTQRRAGLRTVVVPERVAAAVAMEEAGFGAAELQKGQAVMVAARGVTPVLRFALEEARLRQGPLYVVFVKEVAASLLGPVAAPDRPQWQEDPEAARIMSAMLAGGQLHGVTVVPVYVVSESAALTILDLAATLGIDYLVLGAPQRSALVALLKGNVVTEVARSLPPNIHLLIYG